MRPDFLQRRIPWPRDRRWRPGEPISLPDGSGAPTTYRLRGVERDPDPRQAFATVTLEPTDDGQAADAKPDDLLSAAG